MATATALSMHKRANTLSKKKKMNSKKKQKKKDEFTQLVKEINSMPSETDKCYASAALRTINNNNNNKKNNHNRLKSNETEALLKFFQKYFGDDIDDIYIPNWIRIGMFATNNRGIAEQFVRLCNNTKIRCYGRNIRAYQTYQTKPKCSRKYLVHILNINWCINDSIFNQWIHESLTNKNNTLESMKISNIETFCSPLNPNETDKIVIIKLNNEITRDWLLKNEDIKFQNWPFYFTEYDINKTYEMNSNKSFDTFDESAQHLQNNIHTMSYAYTFNNALNGTCNEINNLSFLPTMHMQNTNNCIPNGIPPFYSIYNNVGWSIDDVERLLLNTKLAEQEQLINNLVVQNKLLNDQYVKQQQMLTALQTQNHSVIFDEFIQQKNMNIRLNIKYNELFAKYANLKNKKHYNGQNGQLQFLKNEEEKEFSESNVREWSVEDVICWILRLENGRYLKHKHAIIPNIINQQIDGGLLMKLKLIDISRIGITGYWDQEWLMHHIKKLIKKNMNNVSCCQATNGEK